MYSEKDTHTQKERIYSHHRTVIDTNSFSSTMLTRHANKFVELLSRTKLKSKRKNFFVRRTDSREKHVWEIKLQVMRKYLIE